MQEGWNVLMTERRARFSVRSRACSAELTPAAWNVIVGRASRVAPAFRRADTGDADLQVGSDAEAARSAGRAIRHC
jgi:hypothetical protein